MTSNVMRSKDLLPIKKEFYIILHERHNGLGPIEETQALINVTNGRKTFKKGKSNNNVPIVANWVTLLRFVIKKHGFPPTYKKIWVYNTFNNAIEEETNLKHEDDSN